MQITKINNTSFGNKTKTAEIFEIMLRKSFKSEMATDSIRVVAKDLYPNEKLWADIKRMHTTGIKSLIR